MIASYVLIVNLLRCKFLAHVGKNIENPAAQPDPRGTGHCAQLIAIPAEIGYNMLYMYIVKFCVTGPLRAA